MAHVTWDCTTVVACLDDQLDRLAALKSRPVRPRLAAHRPPRPAPPERRQAPSLAALAAAADFTLTTVRRYGATATVAVIRCLWYGVFGPQPVQVVLVPDRAKTGYDVALASTDLRPGPAPLIERYAGRWSIGVAVRDAKQTTGVGQARNRLRAAVDAPSSGSSPAPSRSAGTRPLAIT